MNDDNEMTVFTSEDQKDNIEAAMDKVAETLKPTRKSDAKGDDSFAKQVLFRANEADHDRWKEAAAKLNISMAEFIRECCNAKASDLLDCPHPLNQRRWYPWSEMCLACGYRIRSASDKKGGR
jgi:predicted HicB family RNase H-like nuclease